MHEGLHQPIVNIFTPYDNYGITAAAFSLLGQPYLLEEPQEAVIIATRANIATTGARRRITEFFCMFIT
jgi:hypothetical protein